jgi:cysteinyl-tRNA synthetase
MIKLYDTLTKNKQSLKPIQPGEVRLYSCGPTVYDYLQIGNWLAFIRWDILYRTLRSSGLKTKWVMNITDVGHLTSDADDGEDKLEKGAKREGKSAWDIAAYYTEDFIRGLDALDIQIKRKNIPKATDAINEQIELVKTLEKKGHTYIIDDGVYFDTTTCQDYGKLGNIDLDNLQAGARVAYNDQKRNITDFALWKFSPKNVKRDMEWDSPWGVGFPGWHLECSALAMKHLGETIDIHAGGIDHIPIHHTNEIAQSECATGKQFSQIWLHSNFLTVDGTKLSKSLGNSYSLQEIEERGFSPFDFRLFALQSHYRTQANFTWESLEAARNRRKTIQAVADLRFQSIARYIDSAVLEGISHNVSRRLEDDLNTPEALAELSKLDAVVDNVAETHSSDQNALNVFIEAIDGMLGLGLLKSNDITTAQKENIEKRKLARADKDWRKSDTIRDKLLQQGVGIKDTAAGQVWYRI